MYDIPEVRAATDALWRCIARHLRNEGFADVPDKLVHDAPLRGHRLWTDSNLFFSQSCGYDVVYRFREHLQVLGTPLFAAAGCANGDYASTIVVQEDSPYHDVLDMFGTIAVINGPESHSGANALFGLVSPYARAGRFFSEIRVSGTHEASLKTLQAGGADVASIDCMTYALLKRYRPAAIEGTRPLGLTYPAPAPPYVTKAGTSVETIKRMQTALRAVFDDPSSAKVCEKLLLGGIQTGSAEAYQRITTEFRHRLRVF